LDTIFGFGHGENMTADVQTRVLPRSGFVQTYQCPREPISTIKKISAPPLLSTLPQRTLLESEVLALGAVLGNDRGKNARDFNGLGFG
jgi:hypothetical protein